MILEKGGWLSSSRSSNADILGYTFGPIFNPKYWNSTWECDSTINQAIFLQNLQPYHLAKCCKIICFFENDLTRQGRLFTFALFILGERLPAREPQHCFQSLRGLFSHHVKRFIQLWYCTVSLFPSWQIHCPHSFTILSLLSLPFAFIVHKGKKRRREEREKKEVWERQEKGRDQQRGGGVKEEGEIVGTGWEEWHHHEIWLASPPES